MAYQKVVVGKKYNRLCVLRRAPNRYTKGGYLKTYYFCRCDCGTEPDLNLIKEYLNILITSKVEYIDYELNWGKGKLFNAKPIY